MAIKISGYRIIRKINHGGMSTVYLAIQISVGRVVALKVMNPGLTIDPTFNERFQREATIVGQLSHPNIISIYDIGREENLNYIAMDYLPGGSVHDKMIEGITADEALRVTKDIANALDHAHERGYIHRDIKPENILFRLDNSAILTDFGVAKGMIGVSRMTHVGTVVGTPQYMSPEQARGQIVDARSDLYSLGVLFYEMLTGSLPYPGEDSVTIVLKHISAAIPKLPRQYQAYQKILNKFLAKDPGQRFQRGREITEAIEKIEASKRARLNSALGADKSSIVALVSALISATNDAIYWQWQNIKSLGWLTREKGASPNQPLTRSARNKISPTLLSPQAQHRTYIQAITHPRQNPVFIGLSVGIFCLILWVIFSYSMQHKFSNKLHAMPHFLQSATAATARLLINKQSTVTPQIAAPVPKMSTEKRVVVDGPNEVEQQSSAAPLLSLSVLMNTSSAGSSVPQITTYALTIKVQPEKAQIKLLNLVEKYKDGIELLPGRYHVQISKTGYETKREWIEIKNQSKEFNYILTETPEAEVTEKPSILAKDSKAKFEPEFVRIPAGSFIMGDDISSRSAPERKINITKPFFIGKYEVTFSEYDAFTQATNRPQPGDNGWGREMQPIINVSWDDAQAYTQWLSKTKSKKYRLPTEAEWEYVARAGTTTRFWWGDSEQNAKGNANCRRGCYSSYSGLFGSKTAPVGSYIANPFGVHDTAGNVAEWVQDCYQDHYDKTAISSAAYEGKDCQKRVVRGGSTKNNAPSLASAARDYNPPETYDEAVGFRVVMEQ
ncbi:MAG: bifunctional serine/threonine-protein kinase/formylglycine-generating enzyme family protein [Pseudomonadota bacterium]